uniref:Cytochrome P450 n=1 Tax=Brassica oleracea var. oleracea TaxID=109376 RepID=A0A0D3DXL4_BRAOL
MFHLFFRELPQKYGAVMLIIFGIDIVVISSKEAAAVQRMSSPLLVKNGKLQVRDRFVNSSIADKGLELELLPIGSGKRICPETRMATVELGLLNLLYFFDWELPQGKRVKDIDLEETGIITLSKRTALQPVPVLHH